MSEKRTAKAIVDKIDSEYCLSHVRVELMIPRNRAKELVEYKPDFVEIKW